MTSPCSVSRDAVYSEVVLCTSLTDVEPCGGRARRSRFTPEFDVPGTFETDVVGVVVNVVHIVKDVASEKIVVVAVFDVDVTDAVIAGEAHDQDGCSDAFLEGADPHLRGFRARYVRARTRTL